MTYTIVDEWCEGYFRGAELSSNEWLAGGEKIAALLSPIYAFTEAMDWQGHNQDDDEVITLQKAIAPNAREIHAYWLARRVEHPQREPEISIDQPNAGRNDPCPCGSGKKFEKCCLH